MLEKAAAIKAIEYTPLGSELRKQASVAEKQQGKLGKVFEPNKKEEDKTKTKEVVLCQIYSTVKVLFLTSTATLKDLLLNVLLIQKKVI